jgi:hypothetical protein
MRRIREPAPFGLIGVQPIYPGATSARLAAGWYPELCPAVFLCAYRKLAAGDGHCWINRC